MLVAIRLYLHPPFPIIVLFTMPAAKLISPAFRVLKYVKPKMQVWSGDKEL